MVTIDFRGLGSSLTASSAPDLSFAPAISPDGRFVVFASYATDLVFGVSSSSQRSKIYARDLESATTQVISLNRLNQVSTTGDSWAPTLVGTNVFFLSSAPDLTATNVTAAALYRRSLSGGPTVRVSTDPWTARAPVCSATK